MVLRLGKSHRATTKWGCSHEFSDPKSDDNYDRDRLHTVRASQLQKLIKDLMDLGNHIATFRQALYAKQVSDFHT